MKRKIYSNSYYDRLKKPITELESNRFLLSGSGFNKKVGFKFIGDYLSENAKTTTSVTDEHLQHWEKYHPEELEEIRELLNNADELVEIHINDFKENIAKITNDLILKINKKHSSDKNFHIRQTSKKFGI